MMNNYYADRLPVKTAARQVAGVLLDMPLASSQDLARVLAKPVSRLHAPTQELLTSGLISHARLGRPDAESKKENRFFFTPQGLQEFGEMPVTWHEEGNRCVLLGRLQVLQWFYRVAGEWQGLGEFRNFTWIDSQSLEAAARYANGWIALFWSGMLETVEELTKRIQRLPADVDGMAVDHPDTWPGVIVFVVPDPWQGELVKRAAVECGVHRSVAVWCISDGSHTQAAEPAQSRGWVRQGVSPRETGNWPWADRVDRSIWSQENTPSVYCVYRIIAEHPGASIKFIRQSTGERQGGKVAEKVCRRLVELGLVEAVPNERPARYRLTPRGASSFAAMERGTHQAYQHRVVNQSWLLPPGPT